MSESTENSGNIYDLLGLIKPYWKKTRWFIPISLIIGVALGGFLYYKKSQEIINFYGKSTFMLSSDDVAYSPGGLGASLGIMIPGSGGGGNKTILLELLKSHRMIEKTMLSSAMVDGKKDLLINHYIELSGYRSAWKGRPDWANYVYPKDYKHDSMEDRDGFLRDVAINMANYYTPVKTDEGIFEISFFYPNESFTKAFLDNFVVTVIEYYTEKKTAKARIALNYAERRHSQLYGRISGQQRSLARNQDQTSEFVFIEDKVPQMKMSRDIEATAEMLQEASKSLAAAQMSLVQETPFLQVIDDVRLPLAKLEPKKEKFGLIGFLAGFLGSLILIVGIIVARDFLKKQKEEYLAKTA